MAPISAALLIEEADRIAHEAEDRASRETS